MTSHRSQLEDEFKNGKIPFAWDKGTYQRFSERNNMFSRVTWDTTYNMYNHSIAENEYKKIGKKGYHRVSYAARGAAWNVYDSFPGAFAWDRNENETGGLTHRISKLPKYESNTTNNTTIVKRMAQVFGACAIGITKLDPERSFIYTNNRENEPIDLPDGLDYAIVMLVEMDYESLKMSPTLPASITTGYGYSKMAFITGCMAQFLRNLGYRAIPSGNDTGLSVPLAVQAGLGQLGRNGLLITPKYGQRVRICKVFTDLPLIENEPIDFGVTDFCRKCKLCAKHCPSQSISYDDDPTWDSPWNNPSNSSGSVYKWYVNGETCYEFWLRNSSDCSNCVRVCPFTKPPGIMHDIARFFIKRFPFFNSFWIAMEKLMAKIPLWRYGKKGDPTKFWDSVEYLGKQIER